jgi:magnesium transporter
MLINCVAYRDGRKLADITIEQISDYLARGDCFVWVAMKDTNDAELDVLAKEFGLHELAVDDAKHGHQRPKIEEYGESLFVVLHTVEVDQENELCPGEVDIFVGKNYILSVRNRTTQGFVNVRERCEREPELLKNGPAFVLYAIMDTVVDRYFPVVDVLEHQLEQIEERIFSKSTSARLNLEEVYALKRKLMVVQHAAAPLIESVGKLHGGRVPSVCASMQEYFRDVSDHVVRITRSIESIREMSTTAIQVNLSLISLNESEVTKKLASYGALFAVPTSIAGIYGMNFKNMPELEWFWGYPLALGLIVLADFLLWTRFRKAKWL